MEYRRLTNGLNDRGILIPVDKDVFEFIKDNNNDYYLSIFKYNEEHKQLFQETGTVAGVTDVTTDRLCFDFDNEFEPDEARKDTITLVERLMNKGIDKRNIQMTFSGNKGFGVELNLDKSLTPKQMKSLAFELAEDLENFDVKIYNASRVLRIYGTKHQKTGLYKIPLSYQQLKELSVDNIIELAKNPPEYNPEFEWNRVSLAVSEKVEQQTKKTTVEPLPEHLDYSMKPKFLTNCRWSIQNGYFKEGDRSTALLCLASTYKNLGFDLEHVYRLLKGTAELQARINNSDRFPDEEIYNNIVMQVFGPSWNNGQYTCREKGNWLQTYCTHLDHPCNHKAEDELKPRTFLDLTDSFKEYVKNIDKNTIHTGLPSIDKYVFLSTGANVGIIGAPGSGKTSIALEILNNTSKAGVKSVFASLDMAKTRIYEKLMYRLTGLSRQELYQSFKDDAEKPFLDKLKAEFGNVNFFKKSSPTVQDIKDYVIKCQEETGEKVKLVMIDYFERVNSDVGDDTAASKRIAGELQDLVDDLDVCLITLVQPNKNALFGGPDQPIYDYTKIKGSSFVYQAFRIIMSAWRPFYNPKDFSNDRFMQMAILKNDLGELSEFAFNWEGKRGFLSEMEDFQRDEFEDLLRQKLSKEKGEDDNGGLNF
jgi:hypothetical protein